MNETSNDMDSPTGSLEMVRNRGFSEATDITLSAPPNSKVQIAWNNVKTNFKDRSSVPDLRRWMSFTRSVELETPEDHTAAVEAHPEDGRESLFCQSLLGLMEMTHRFDYLDFTNEQKRRRSSENDAAQNPRAKRFSWTR